MTHFAPLLAFAALPLLPSPVVVARGPQGSELPSVLVIAKSSNHNQIHYAARLGRTCAPAGSSPVRPYWRMLEHGPDAVEPLSESESRVLGVDRQEVRGDTVAFSLRGMPGRTFTVHTGRAADGRCASWVSATIAGTSARVTSVFAQQKLFGVDYVLLTGLSSEGVEVRERVHP